MTNMILVVLLMYWVFCNGALLAENIRDYEEQETEKMMNSLQRNVPSAIGRIFYLPVTIYSFLHDLVKERMCQEEAR